MLSIPESTRLAELEEQIESGLATFVVVGQALAEINGSRLYRLSYGTFEDYCAARWDFSCRHAYRLMEAVEVISDLRPPGSQIQPMIEKQARALVKVPPEQRAEAWDKAVESAGGKQPTTQQVYEAVEIVMPSGAPADDVIRITSSGMEFKGDITPETFSLAVQQIKQTKDGFHCALADLITAGTQTLGESAVEETLVALDLDHADVMRSTALNKLPPAARALGLSAGHYVAVAQSKELVTDEERMKWLKLAKKHSLTPLQLKRSILAGKVVSSEDVQLAGGRNSGIITLQNVMFQLSQYVKQMKKLDPFEGWEAKKKAEALEIIKPFFDLAAILTKP